MYKKPCNNTVLGKTEFIQRHHFDEKYFLYIDFIALFSLSYFKYNKTTCASMNLNVEFEFCKVLFCSPLPPYIRRTGGKIW